MRIARLLRLLVMLAVGAVLIGPGRGADPGAPLPGATPHPAALRAALAAGPRGDEPRTRHRNPDGSPRYTNRLLLEDSPYLRQHAHNPVDWYPWGDEAFDRARREQRPVLLSVGYSTCHWCHVMEEESFDDEEIATELNRHYVAIKVDRERRPDIDAVYMTAVQAMAGNGGWPMTVWLTPERQPFYGGTYFPARDGERGARFGFLTLLRRLHEAYETKPAEAAAAAADMSERVRQLVAVAPGDAAPSAGVLHRAYAHFRDTFDATNGGFGRAPKFPRTVELEFLLRYHRRTGDPQALVMVERTLDAMASGGIRDQVGGGFHRYATDSRWRVPHFEKMLYDNALLVVAYLEAYQVTRRPELAEVVRDTLAWAARDMAAPAGGFYAAMDADSEGEEGRYYTWTAAEIRAALGAEEAGLALAYYGVAEDGRQTLHTSRPLVAVGSDPATLARARARLLEIRATRVPPHTDRKVIAAWNGLMISALARAAAVLEDPRHRDAAARTADFVLTRLSDGSRLRRSWFDGRASGDGYLEDYAFVIAGLLDLYAATFEPRWLARALGFQAVLDAHYWDAAGGGYFRTSDDGEPLLAREKPSWDGAEPSGNSVAVGNLLRLAELTSDDRHRARAEAALRALEPVVASAPAGAPRLLAAVDFHLDRPKEIVLVAPEGGSARELLATVHGTYVPNGVVVLVTEGASQRALTPLVPLVAEKRALGGRATAYVCERQVCDLPTTDPAVLTRQLGRVAPLPDGPG